MNILIKKTFSLLVFLLLSLIIISSVFITVSISRIENRIKKLQENKRSIENNIKNLSTARDYLALDIYRTKTENIVQELRKLSFKKEPEYTEISRDKLELIIKKEMEKENPEEKIEKTRKTMAVFGFISNDFDLEKSINDLYKEQIAGFYDTDKKTLFSIKDMPLSGNLQRSILAHELTHVLQDQHFDLDSFIDDDSLNDDEKLSRQALVEGDATFITQIFYLKTLNLSIIFDILSYLQMDQSQFNKAPHALRENLLFPYIHGIAFINHLYLKGGWKEINRFYKNPPLSTEQILHPEKYYNRESPVTVNIPSLSNIISDYAKIEENVLGEFNTFVLFSIFLNKASASVASKGWGGDCYVYYENPDNEQDNLFIWKTVWDTEKDAIQFESLYSKLLGNKFKNITASKLLDFEILESQAPERYVFIKRINCEVICIECSQKNIFKIILNYLFYDKQ